MLCWLCCHCLGGCDWVLIIVMCDVSPAVYSSKGGVSRGSPSDPLAFVVQSSLANLVLCLYFAHRGVCLYTVGTCSRCLGGAGEPLCVLEACVQGL